VAATQETNGAFVSEETVPVSQQANLTTTSTGANSSQTTNSGTTEGFQAVTSGNYTMTGGTYTGATVQYSSDPNAKLNVTNTNFKQSSVAGNSNSNSAEFGGGVPTGKSNAKTSVIGTSTSFEAGNDSIKFTNTLDKRSAHNMSVGNDSISFKKDSQSVRSSYNMGEGADSITFKGGKVNQSKIALGQDSAKDVVTFSPDTSTKNIEISEFGVEDTLRVGGQTFNYGQIAAKDGKIADGITIDLI